MPSVGSLDRAVCIGDGGHERIFADDRIWNDALRLDHNAVGRARDPSITEPGTQMLSVTISVGPAHMNERPIGPQWRYRDHLFGLADRIGKLNQILIKFDIARADAAAPGKKFLAGGCRKQSGVQNVFAAFPDFDLTWLCVFAQIVPDRAVH